MADTKISALPPSAATAADIIPVARGGANYAVTADTIADLARDDLASTASGKGASLVSLENGQTVQDAINAYGANGGAALIGKTGGGTVQDAITSLETTNASLLDLTATLAVTGAAALAITDLNKLVIASGSANYTINLPPAMLAGSALKLEVDRTATCVVTVQAAAGSGKLVNGLPIIDMIAGESALAVYDGTNWRFMDWVRVPLLAEMMNTAASAQSLATGSFNDVPLATAGNQLMQSDLSALWSASGGYFTAPRAGVYAVDLHLWAEHSGGPGQYDIGVYTSSTGGGGPSNNNFARVSVGTETFRTLTFRTTLSVAKGFKIYPCVRPNSPLSDASIVAGATLNSRATITEAFRA